MKRRDKEPTDFEMDFGEALKRFIQTDTTELANLIEEARQKGEDVERYVKERLAVSGEVLDEPQNDSVYDFLYQDVRRVGSFLDQFDVAGHLQQIVQS
jgi:hypothetical protein